MTQGRSCSSSMCDIRRRQSTAAEHNAFFSWRQSIWENPSHHSVRPASSCPWVALPGCTQAFYAALTQGRNCSSSMCVSRRKRSRAAERSAMYAGALAHALVTVPLTQKLCLARSTCYFITCDRTLHCASTCNPAGPRLSGPMARWTSLGQGSRRLRPDERRCGCLGKGVVVVAVDG